MKINFNQPFKDFRGDDMRVNGKLIMIANEVGRTLYNAGANNSITSDEKYKAYKICTRMAMNNSEIDIDSEEATLILRLCADEMTAGAYGQIKDLIEK